MPLAIVGICKPNRTLLALTRRAVLLSLAAVIVCALPVKLHAEHAHKGLSEPAAFGTIAFENSWALSVQAEFRNAVALLHAFAADANEFVDVARHDPSCAIAWWGAAMAARGN